MGYTAIMWVKDANLSSETLEPTGKRIARLRVEQGWTQQSLASRLAISRVAVSHIEMDLSIPSERTITLLAGLFKMNPYELVEGTTYPKPKMEKLPQVACCFTRLELDLAKMENDLAWLGRLKQTASSDCWMEEIRGIWAVRLAKWSEETIDERERELIVQAAEKLRGLILAPGGAAGGGG